MRLGAGFLQMGSLTLENLARPRLTSRLIFWKGMQFCVLRGRLGKVGVAREF